MNCRAYQDLLQLDLDGAEPAPEAEQHLRECPACAGATHRLRQALRLLAPPAVPPEFSERIVRQVCAEQAQVRRLRARRRLYQRLRTVVGLAAAACLLMAVAIAFSRRGPGPSPSTDSAGVSPDKPVTLPPRQPRNEGRKTPIAPPDHPLPLRESMVEAGSAVAGRVVSAASSVGETASFLMPTPPMSVPDDLSQPLEPSARPFREAGAEVSAGLDPLTNSARRAVGRFLSDLPSGAQTAPQANPS